MYKTNYSYLLVAIYIFTSIAELEYLGSPAWVDHPGSGIWSWKQPEVKRTLIGELSIQGFSVDGNMMD